jgi:hypothetical protein
MLSPPKMNRDLIPSRETVGYVADRFLYFFLGLRKGEIRRRVAALKARHPDEGPAQLARRLITVQTPLSFLGGALLHVPMFIPAGGLPLKVLGVAGGTTVMMRMHMALLLEIAHLFERDIDDVERLKEMAAVIALTGLASGGTPMLSRALSLNPYYALLAGGMSVSSISQLIGETAIRYYNIGKAEAAPSALAPPVAVASPPLDEAAS